MDSSASDEIKIVCIAPDLYREMWPHVVGYLQEGASAANMTMADVFDELSRGRAQLWAIMQDQSAVLGAFLTAVRIADCEPLIDVFALSGGKMPRWGKLLGEKMKEFAEDEGASRVVFCGRDGWARVLPQFKITGRRGEAAVFERAIV